VARWVASGPSDAVSNLNDPLQPPYGTGNVVKFHAANAGDNFTYAGEGFPDDTDTQIQFGHREDSSVAFAFTISITTAAGAATSVAVTSDPSGPATFDSGSGTLTVPIGPGGDTYRTSLLDLAELVSTLAGDSLHAITGFKVTLSSTGDMYFDNLTAGNIQPQDSLCFSYDVYNGQVDQAYIRTGAMAWVCFAYAVYMAMSLDYSPALYLGRMLNFLLTLQSSAADLTGGLLYLGYGKYQDPGYQFIPGLQNAASTEHNVDAYFAFKRAANILPTAAVQLVKAGAITSDEAVSMNSTAATVSAAADTISTALLTNLYIAPDADPGHFAEGASVAGLDTAQALDASGTWSALFCHAIGDDTKAAECLKFVYQKFYLEGRQILTSSVASSYNQAYQQTRSFDGFKTYNDSAGGYSGSPPSVWQEGTWGMITALLRTSSVPEVSSYFAAVEGSLEGFLTKLVSGQREVRSTTGDGSLINYSLAARGLPYEFVVWPSFTATAWFWITAMNPGILLATDTDPQSLPYLFIPAGQGQRVNELEGQTSIGNFEIESIDPAGVLRGLAAQQNLIGKVARFKMGFPGQPLGDFTPLHTVQIVSSGFTSEGRITFTCADVQRFMLSALLWMSGGPSSWTPDQPVPAPPRGRSFAANAFPTSDRNPRWVQGHPLDIYLVALQNELGVGQDPSLPVSAWTIYRPGDDATLINPNPYLDVPGILALRDGPFSGDWFEFKITRPTGGKQWLEDQILKVLGLYTVVRADGRLALKSMKSPASLHPVMALNEKNIIGIPEISRLPVVNVLTVRMSTDDTDRETAARQYRDEITFVQASSVAQYKQQYQQQVESDGLRPASGGILRAFLLADRVFRRHAFGTPQYRLKAFLSTTALELGDFVWLNHPLVPDFATGGIGLTNVICEIVDRQPNYGKASMEFSLLDTRFINLTAPQQVAPLSANVPPYAQASAAQRSTYLFVSSGSAGGLNSDGTPGSTIF
jgi:hypothetical protein